MFTLTDQNCRATINLDGEFCFESNGMGCFDPAAHFDAFCAAARNAGKPISVFEAGERYSIGTLTMVAFDDGCEGDIERLSD